MHEASLDSGDQKHEPEELDMGKSRRRFYIAGVIFGSIATVYCRAITTRQFAQGLGCWDEPRRFANPYFFATMMAIGMSLAMCVYKINRACRTGAVMFTMSSLHFRHLMVIWGAALCDLYFSVAFATSAIYVGSSTAVALRFFDLLFVFLYLRLYWKKKFLPYSVTSFFMVIGGLGLVSIGEILGGQHSRANIGAVLFQLSAQFVSATKSVFEQIITHETDISPACLCGMEGMIEMVVIMTIAYPILYWIPVSSAGLHEDLCDAVMMVIHSKVLSVLFFVYPMISCFFNICVIGVIQLKNGATYTVLEMANTCLVWLIDLVIYYVFDGDVGVASDMGVKWSHYSYFRLLGSLTVLIAALVFIRVIKLPCCRYETPNVARIPLRPGDFDDY